MKIEAIAALIVAATAPTPPLATAPDPARLILNFEPNAQTGAIMVSLFDSEDAYSRGTPVRQAKIIMGRHAQAAIFADLPPGLYAMKAFHDVDGDGRMNTNPFGVPTEPFAFSNNARGNMGPASWDRAKLMVKGETSQTIGLQ